MSSRSSSVRETKCSPLVSASSTARAVRSNPSRVSMLDSASASSRLNRIPATMSMRSECTGCRGGHAARGAERRSPSGGVLGGGLMPLVARLRLQERVANPLEAGGRVLERPQEICLLVGVEPDDDQVALDALLEPARELGVLHACGELEDEAALHGDAGEEHPLDPIHAAGGCQW